MSNDCDDDMYTGEKIATATLSKPLLGFTPSGDGVWCAAPSISSSGKQTASVSSYAFVRDNVSNTIKLKHDMDFWDPPPSNFPWDSPYGYQVTDNGWILSSSGKKLLWLPHQWRSNKLWRKLSGPLHPNTSSVLFCTLPRPASPTSSTYLIGCPSPM